MSCIWGNSPLVLKKFLLYIQTVKAKSQKTVDEYFFDLRTFFRYMKMLKKKCKPGISFDEISIEDIDIEFVKTISSIDIFEYMNYLIQVRQNEACARSRKVASLRSFFKYLTVKVKLLDNDPMKEVDTPKLKKTLPKYMTLDESIRFLETIEKYAGNHKERDYCMATFFLNCGMRLSELVGINLGDIGPDYSVRIFGKGSKERILYLNSACVSSLEAYKKVRGEAKYDEDKDALFLSRSKKRISCKTVQYFMTNYFKLACLSHKGLSTHKLRHTAATLMYQEGGVDIRVLKDILGHKSISLTQIYTHTNPQSIKQALNSNPLSKSVLGENDGL